jgi:hypothetical protein
MKVSLVKPNVKSGSRGFIQNLFCKFWTFLQVYTNFGSLKQFLLFKRIRKTIKSPTQYWVETGPRLQPTRRDGLPCAVGRKAGWGMAWQPRPAGQTASAARCNARSPRADRARDSAVACSPAARRCLDGDKLLPKISRGP